MTPAELELGHKATFVYVQTSRSECYESGDSWLMPNNPIAHCPQLRQMEQTGPRAVNLTVGPTT